jgi:hypothetical protein
MSGDDGADRLLHTADLQPLEIEMERPREALTMKNLTKKSQKTSWLVLFGAVIAATALYYVDKIQATPAEKFTGTTLAVGKFDRINVANHTIVEGADPNNKNWLSLQKTQGTSDVYVQSNVWQPGGSTGWHTHPGHSLIIVTAGTVTPTTATTPAARRLSTRWEWDLSIRAMATFTISAMKAASRHERLRCR